MANVMRGIGLAAYSAHTWTDLEGQDIEVEHLYGM